ncbi:transposase [Corynebacterium macginleyi]|nr:transposase [Corynebacterium macginleyi]
MMIGHLFMMMLIARFIRSEKDSDEVYGAPRITAELTERYQISENRKTVAKRMRLMGIEGDVTACLCARDNDSI